MEDNIAIAKSSAVRISTRKVRLVADSIRNMSAEQALNALSQIEKRGSVSLGKTLKSAIANAVNKGLVKEKLFIKSLEVNQAPALKRYHPSTRGRIHPYKRKSSHIRIVLAEMKNLSQNSKNFEKEEPAGKPKS